MESRKTYGELFTKPSLSQEENNKIIEFERYVEKSKKYAPYLSAFNQEVVQTYVREILFLESLKEEEKNDNIKARIQVGERNQKIISLDDEKRQRVEEQRQKEQNLQLKLDKRAGYMNASILIFVICNLGLFLATFLLMLK